MAAKRRTSTYIKVEGTKELRRALRQLEDKADAKRLGQELKQEYRRAAEIVTGTAKDEVKLGATGSSGSDRWGGAHKPTGKLAASIKPKGALRGAAVVAGGPKVPYAAPVHWGWYSRPNRQKGWRGGPIQENRFMTRAANKRRDEVRDAIESGIFRMMREVEAAAAKNG